MHDWLPINWELMKNPYNWVIIILMLAIAGFALHLVLPQYFDGATTTTQGS